MKNLDLNNPKLIQYLIKFFRLNTKTLTHLQISGSHLPITTLSQLCGYLIRNTTSLQWLDISSHPLLKSSASHQLVSRLKQILVHCSVHHLDLSSMILDKHVYKIIEGI